MATTVLGAGAMFTLYTYVAPVLTELTGASNAFIAMSLALIGIGFTFGNGCNGDSPADLFGQRKSTTFVVDNGPNHRRKEVV